LPIPAAVEDPKNIVYKAIRVVARRPSFEVGSLLVAANDNVPALNEPKAQAIIAADNLVALAGRLEAHPIIKLRRLSPVRRCSSEWQVRVSSVTYFPSSSGGIRRQDKPRSPCTC
jgi:hypothetical protein